MDYLKKYYNMKGVGYVEYYLGGDLPDLSSTWNSKYALSAKTYIGNLIDNSKNMLGMKYTSYNNPFDSNYHPKQDTSSLCTPQEQAYYCPLIGSANWCVTLGRYDIAYATRTLAQYSIAPRTGHLQAVF